MPGSEDPQFEQKFASQSASGLHHTLMFSCPLSHLKSSFFRMTTGIPPPPENRRQMLQ